jgi:hypothetical protein
MAKSTKEKSKMTVARLRGAVKAERQRVKRYVVSLIEKLPIEPKTGKPKHGAITDLMLVQK